MTDPTTQTQQPGAPYLAVDVVPDVANGGNFVLDVSELDGPDLLLWSLDDPGAWRNIVCDVTALSYHRGASRTLGLLTQAEAGTCTLTVLDTLRQFDPMNNWDVIHKGTPLRLRAWGYAPALQAVEARRNRVPNPAPASATGWTGSYGTGGAGSTSYSAAGGPAGGGYFRRTWATAETAATHSQYADGRAASALPIPVTPGEVLSGAIQVRGSWAGDVRVGVLFYDAAGVQKGSAYSAAVTLTANTWTRLTVVNVTAPAGATNAIVGAFGPSTGALAGVGATLDVAQAQLESGPVAGAYFDGATAGAANVEGAVSYSWTGTVNASASVQLVQQFTTTRWDAVLFTGEVDELRVQYQKDDAPVVTITGLDLVGALVAWESEGRADPGVGMGDDLRARALRVLQETGLGGALTTTTTTATTQPTPPATLAAQLIFDRFGSGLTISEDWSWPGCPQLVTDWKGHLLSQRVVPGVVQAAALILDRLQSGQQIFEDWTWYGYPPLVRAYHDPLVSQFYASNPGSNWPGNKAAIQAWLANYLQADARGWLAAYVAATTPPPAGQPVTEVTDAARLSSDSDSSYAVTLAPTVLAKPWQELTAATEAELGRMWVDSAGRMVVRARGSQLSGPVRGTLSDVHGEAPQGVHCCVEDAHVVYGVEGMVNLALAGRRQLPGETGGDATLVRREDGASQARYGRATVDRRALELATDEQLSPWAEAVVVGHTLPELRVDSVTPAPAPDDLDSAVLAWRAVCQTDLGDRWRFLFRPDVGPAVDRTLGVLGIDLQATPDAWTVTWTTADAVGTGGWFVLDVSSLDGTDLLAPYSVPA